MDDLREKVARALAAAFNASADPEGDLWDQWVDETDAALAAIHASGHRIVPVCPTNDQRRAGFCFLSSLGFDASVDIAHELYSRMLTAYGQKGE